MSTHRFVQFWKIVKYENEPVFILVSPFFLGFPKAMIFLIHYVAPTHSSMNFELQARSGQFSPPFSSRSFGYTAPKSFKQVSIFVRWNVTP